VYCSVLRRSAVCCGVLQCIAVCFGVVQRMQYHAVCCTVLHCAAMCCGVVQYVALCCSALRGSAVCCSVWHCSAVCCNGCVSCLVPRSAVWALMSAREPFIDPTNPHISVKENRLSARMLHISENISFSVFHTQISPLYRTKSFLA